MNGSSELTFTLTVYARVRLGESCCAWLQMAADTSSTDETKVGSISCRKTDFDRMLRMHLKSTKAALLQYIPLSDS